jgi:hypothetical protein
MNTPLEVLHRGKPYGPTSKYYGLCDVCRKQNVRVSAQKKEAINV